MAKASKWLPIFEEFVKDLRISSKEVTSTDERGVKLSLWESQKRFLSEIASGLDDDIRTFICLKSRQLGITTISLAIDVFWLAVHHNLTGALVSDTDKNRNKNRAQIERYVKSLPDGYFGESFTIVKSNINFTLFSNGSRLDYLVAGTKAKGTSWGEGEGYAFAHLTECAAYGDAQGLASFEESFAQTNPDRLYIYESTAKGFNHFRDKYLRAKEEQFTKKAFFIGWWASNVNRIERKDPRFEKFGNYKPAGEERDLVLMVRTLYGYNVSPEQLAWIRWKPTDTSADDPNLLDQNQPWVENQAFVMTGHSFFQTRIIAQDMRILEESDIVYKGYAYEYGNDFFQFKMYECGEEERDQIELKIWEEPVENGKYVIGADPAYGRNDHKDKHVSSVWRCYSDKIVQVAEFATSEVEAKHFAWVLAHMASAYRDCIVNLEIGGPGRMIMLEWEHLRGMLKAEMYAQQVRQMGWDDAMDQARWYLYHRPDAMGAGYASNFETTFRTKSEIMHQMRGAYATRELDIKSMYLLGEMSVVIQDGSEIGAPESRSENCKDDRVFACALANRAWLNWVRPTMLAEGLTFARVNDQEMGVTSSLTNRLNEQVFRFFKNKEEAEDVEPERGPKWLVDRGLI